MRAGFDRTESSCASEKNRRESDRVFGSVCGAFAGVSFVCAPPAGANAVAKAAPDNNLMNERLPITGMVPSHSPTIIHTSLGR
jgi:hypothetical protein